MAKTQITTAAEAAALVKDGMTLMVGGLYGKRYTGTDH